MKRSLPERTTRRPARQPAWVLSIRYGIGAVMVIAGIVMLVVSPAGLGIDGFAMAAGGGFSVLLLNFLFRLGVSGDLEREREEQARAYFDRHGEWPDETAARRRLTEDAARAGRDTPSPPRPPSPSRGGGARPGTRSR